MFNDKRIEKLEERIEKLEIESKLVVIPDYYRWSMFFPFPEVSLKDVVEKIMDHLGLKVSYERAQEEKYTLQTISGLTPRAPDARKRGAKKVSSKSKKVVKPARG